MPSDKKPSSSEGFETLLFKNLIVEKYNLKLGNTVSSLLNFIQKSVAVGRKGDITGKHVIVEESGSSLKEQDQVYQLIARQNIEPELASKFLKIYSALGLDD